MDEDIFKNPISVNGDIFKNSVRLDEDIFENCSFGLKYFLKIVCADGFFFFKTER